MATFCALRGGVGRLAALEQRVAAECDDDAHGSHLPVAGHEGVERRLLGRQAVGGLLPHGAVGAVDHGGRDLLAAVGGQAVQEDGVAAPRDPSARA